MSATTTPPQHAGTTATPKMSHKEILEALSGLLLGMFVAILSSTVVSNALPVIVNDLDGTESSYTWVVTAALLATTISTPIWGKLSDLFSKKLLVQIALVIFVVASAVAGLSTNMAMLITLRVFQGIGGGGLLALAQVVLATMVSPRERGRYSGYLGATFALATVGGPLIGGVLTEHLSWHWTFYVGVPFAVIAFVVLQFKLKLPPQPKREVSIDYLGAFLLAAGISALLIWVSLAGDKYDWASWQTAALVGAGVVFLALAALAESRAKEPIVPLKFFRNPTIALSALASLFVGVAMFGATIFLAQYFQLGRGESPTMAGVMTIPMIIGLFLASTVAGQFITRTGKWKAWLVSGGFLLTAGLALMGTIEYDTNYWIVAPYMALIGLGVGMMMQNLVLAVQNVAEPRDLGSASSFVAFSRSLGGAIGVSALGAVLGHRVTDHLTSGIADAGIDPATATSSLGASATGIPNLAEIAEPVRSIVMAAYGSGIADVFLIAAPFALVALVVTFFFKERALRSDDGGAAPVAVEAAPAPGTAPATVDGSAPVNGTAPLNGTAPANGTANGSVRHHALTRDGQDGTAAANQPVRTDAGLSVSGAVRHHDGRALAGAVVTIADQTGQQVARTTSDADGRYAVDLPTGGTYLLIVAAAHVAPSATLVGVGDQPVRRDVVLSGRSAITGRVLTHAVDDAGSTGVQGALVTLTDVTGEVVGSTRSDDGGGYSFDQLMGGSYVLTAQSDAHRPLARSIEVPDSGALAADLLLTGGGRLTGTVVAASDGRRVSEATVTLVDAEGGVVGTTTTGDDGSYTFEDLAGGHYTLTAAGFSPVATGVDVQEDSVAATRIELGRDGVQARSDQWQSQGQQ